MAPALDLYKKRRNRSVEGPNLLNRADILREDLGASRIRDAALKVASADMAAANQGRLVQDFSALGQRTFADSDRRLAGDFTALANRTTALDPRAEGNYTGWSSAVNAGAKDPVYTAADARRKLALASPYGGASSERDAAIAGIPGPDRAGGPSQSFRDELSRISDTAFNKKALGELGRGLSGTKIPTKREAAVLRMQHIEDMKVPGTSSEQKQNLVADLNAKLAGLTTTRMDEVTQVKALAADPYTPMGVTDPSIIADISKSAPGALADFKRSAKAYANASQDQAILLKGVYLQNKARLDKIIQSRGKELQRQRGRVETREGFADVLKGKADVRAEKGVKLAAIKEVRLTRGSDRRYNDAQEKISQSWAKIGEMIKNGKSSRAKRTADIDLGLARLDQLKEKGSTADIESGIKGQETKYTTHIAGVDARMRPYLSAKATEEKKFNKYERRAKSLVDSDNITIDGNFDNTWTNQQALDDANRRRTAARSNIDRLDGEIKELSKERTGYINSRAALRQKPSTVPTTPKEAIDKADIDDMNRIGAFNHQVGNTPVRPNPKAEATFAAQWARDNAALRAKDQFEWGPKFKKDYIKKFNYDRWATNTTK